MLTFVPDHFKTKRMCESAVEDKSETIEFVPVHFKTKRMCERTVKDEPEALEFVPDHFKMQKMCDKVVKDDSYSLQLVPDWFVTHQKVKIWHDDDDDDDDDDDEFIQWYSGYQKHKAQKAKVKEELMPIAWHPSRWWDWCIPEDEKKETAKLWK